MSLQGPIIVVADGPANALVDALGAAGAFPLVQSKWGDAPTAFVAVKPCAVVIAEPGAPPAESTARMLSLQIATVNGPMVATIGLVDDKRDAAIPVALPADASLPPERIIARLQSAMRVRALHATVLRRIELFVSNGGALPPLPVGDALNDATVLTIGRGPLYPALGVAMGEQAKMIGALSLEAAFKQLEEIEVDGIVIGDGFSPRTIETFLTLLSKDARFHETPIAIMGGPRPAFPENLPNIDHMATADPERLVTRMVPLVRMHAFEARLKRTLKMLETDGMFDPATGLLTGESFLRDLSKAIAEATDRSQALSLARFSFDVAIDERTWLDGARLVGRLVRNIDFACLDEGAIVVAFTQTDLKSAHVVARRIAGALKNTMLASHRGNENEAANVTLASLKNGDTIESLMQRVFDTRMVAAE